MDIALAQVALAVVEQQLGPGHASVQLVDTAQPGCSSGERRCAFILTAAQRARASATAVAGSAISAQRRGIRLLHEQDMPVRARTLSKTSVHEGFGRRRAGGAPRAA